MITSSSIETPDARSFIGSDTVRSRLAGKAEEMAKKYFPDGLLALDLVIEPDTCRNYLALSIQTPRSIRETLADLVALRADWKQSVAPGERFMVSFSVL